MLQAKDNKNVIKCPLKIPNYFIEVYKCYLVLERADSDSAALEALPLLYRKQICVLTENGGKTAETTSLRTETLDIEYDRSKAT